jgi:hypothetical protein
MKPHRGHWPFGILIVVAVVGLAVFLMFLALAGTSGPSSTASNSPGGAIPAVSNEPATAAPNTLRNDTSADSARGGAGPLNRSK